MQTLKARRPKLKRVVLAFAAAPLGGSGLVAAVALVFGMAIGGPPDFVGAIAATSFIWISILGYAVAIVLGIPGYLLFRHFGWIRRAHWVLLCAALGSVAGAVWPAVTLLRNGADDTPVKAIGFLAIAGMLVGAASGFVFGRIIKIEPPRIDDVASTFD